MLEKSAYLEVKPKLQRPKAMAMSKECPGHPLRNRGNVAKPVNGRSAKIVDLMG